MQIFDDTYQTIGGKAEGLYKEKGSKFIALAYPVISEEEVKEILLSLRKEYHDARHHCYSYIIGFKGEHWRANDDGEPSGTAGRPIHGQIISKNLTNILIVVIRYFGGTKLGVSGLINAYKMAAADALEHANVVVNTVNNIYKITFNYLAMNDIMRLVKDENFKIMEQNFDTSCFITVGIRQSRTESVLGKIEKIDSALANFLKTV
ncbi:MAG: YigZ family protein [Bacteroidales bacterium]|nr:MAG: YigZ family protein [Bacteroidales bacterium]